MKASGLTVGGFYKHFTSRDVLFAEAMDESVRHVGAMLTDWAKQAPRGEFWREIIKKYLSIEHCEDPAMGCPIAALAPGIARTRPAIKRKIRESERQLRFANITTNAAQSGGVEDDRPRSENQNDERARSTSSP
jgi:AcrR family transcriptional regulator